MKQSRLNRSLCMLLALLTVISLFAGCIGSTASGDDTTVASGTESGQGEQTRPTPDTQPAADINQPKPGNWVTTTDLVLPAYGDSIRVEPVTYTFTEADSEGFGVKNVEVDGSTITVPRTVGGVYTDLTVNHDRDMPLTCSFKLTCEAWDPAPWITLFVGMRLAAGGPDATSHNNVWFSLRGNRIGLRVGDWANVTEMTVPVDFSQETLVTIVDDPATNVITVYAGEDENKVEIAHLVLDGKTVSLYAAGAEEPFVTDTVSSEIPASGNIHLWNHICGATIRDLTVSTSRVEGNSNASGIKPNSQDLLADTWVGTDGADRTLAVGDGTVTDAKVGIFYFLWNESTNNHNPIINHTAAYMEGGIEKLWETLQSGSLGYSHYWAEPYFGYYAADDEWVLRKHGAMLAEAGVDFVFFDTTNGLLYPQNYMALLRVWSQMRQEGYNTPDVCFLCQGGNQAEFNFLWNNLYALHLYEDMWFRWNGKPLILFTNRNTVLTGEAADFFTVKYSWANTKDSWYIDYNGIDCWSWGTMYPQRGGYGYDEKNQRVLEQMVVMCGFWANGSYGTNGGRSYTKENGIPTASGAWDMGFGLMETTTGLGLAFQEQFDWAIKKNPQLIMITGWNEWVAGRWEGGAAIGQTIANEYVVSANPADKEYNYFVDNITPEYSRDVEPMKGGFGDNYYYQMASNVRLFKGARTVETAFGQWAIDLSGSVGQWYSVGPEYVDLTGDVFHRNHLSYAGGLTYTNDTGRNDLATAKVSSDDTYLYFCVSCADDITAAEGSNWMNLFLKTDGDDSTGWYGFDFVLNRSRDDSTVSVERFTGKNEWAFETVGSAAYTVSGNVMQIRVEKKLVGYTGTFDFKWADNSVDDGEIMGFLDLGDAAPDGRYCYRFTTVAQEETVPDCLTNDMVVLKSGSYNAYVAGQSVRICEDNTNATLLASDHDFWLPVDFLASALGIDASSAETYNHYGVTYVKANDLVAAAGKTVTITPDGLLVIADSAITDTGVLDVLYRNLR